MTLIALIFATASAEAANGWCRTSKQQLVDTAAIIELVSAEMPSDTRNFTRELSLTSVQLFVPGGNLTAASVYITLFDSREVIELREGWVRSGFVVKRGLSWN
mgnify:FL=1